MRMSDVTRMSWLTTQFQIFDCIPLVDLSKSSKYLHNKFGLYVYADAENTNEFIVKNQKW